MHGRAKHSIHQSHFGWNNANQPVLTIAPGETMEFKTTDSSGGQAQANSTTVADIAQARFYKHKVNPVPVPLYIDGAAPGDAVKVILLDFPPSAGAGPPISRASACSPTSSRNPPSTSGNTTTASMAPAAYGPSGGAAQALLRHHRPGAGRARTASCRPRRVGGNMDIRDIGGGDRAILPVEVAGGLFRSATPMPPRATAKSAARRSRAR